MHEYLRRLYLGQTFMAPEGDEGTAANGDPGTGRGAKKEEQKPSFLTQEQVNAIIAKERRDLETKWQERYTNAEKARSDAESRLNTIAGEFDEFKKILAEANEELEQEKGPQSITGNPELDEYLNALAIPPGIKDKEAYLALKRPQFFQTKEIKTLKDSIEKQNEIINKLTAKADTEEKARLQAEAERQEALRNAEIKDALAKNRCIDVENGAKIFADRVSWDPTTRELKFRRKDGTLSTVLEGITDEMPAYLIQPGSTNGGSGSAGGGRPGNQTADNLAKLKDAMETAYAKASGNPRDVRAMTEYQRARREYMEASKGTGARQ